MLQTTAGAISAIPLRLYTQSRSGPSGNPKTRMALAQLCRSIVTTPPGGGLRVAVTLGAARGVGTSHIVDSLANLAASKGYAVGSLDLGGLTGDADGVAEDRMIGKLDGFLDAEARESRLDLLLIDAAPIQDSLLTARLAGRPLEIFLVVEANRTSEARIRDTLRAIEICGGKCAGFVLNHRRKWPV